MPNEPTKRKSGIYQARILGDVSDTVIYYSDQTERYHRIGGEQALSDINLKVTNETEIFDRLNRLEQAEKLLQEIYSLRNNGSPLKFAINKIQQFIK